MDQFYHREEGSSSQTAMEEDLTLAPNPGSEKSRMEPIIKFQMIVKCGWIYGIFPRKQIVFCQK
jgi:hypothetical protein